MPREVWIALIPIALAVAGGALAWMIKVERSLSVLVRAFDSSNEDSIPSRMRRHSDHLDKQAEGLSELKEEVQDMMGIVGILEYDPRLLEEMSKLAVTLHTVASRRIDKEKGNA